MLNKYVLSNIYHVDRSFLNLSLTKSSYVTSDTLEILFYKMSKMLMQKTIAVHHTL